MATAIAITSMTRASVFADCCKMNNVPYGRCVPKTIIPMSLQSNLDDDTCANTESLGRHRQGSRDCAALASFFR